MKPDYENRSGVDVIKHDLIALWFQHIQLGFIVSAKPKIEKSRNGCMGAEMIGRGQGQLEIKTKLNSWSLSGVTTIYFDTGTCIHKTKYNQYKKSYRNHRHLIQ